jgi:hypothetical protein
MLRLTQIKKPSAARYRATNLDFSSAGEHQVLLHNSKYQRVKLVSKEVANLLAHCNEFRTLDDHISNAFGHLQLTQGKRVKIKKELEALVLDNFMLLESSVLEQLQKSSTIHEAKRITTLCIPTRNRIEAFVTCLESYLENFQHHHRTIAISVFDDSEAAETRQAYRQLLYKFKRKASLSILYAGLEEKQKFTSALVQRSSIPEDVITFALLGQEDYGITTIGANRNAMLLHTVGEAILCVDDDTVCQLSPTPHKQSGVAFSWGANPIDVTFYPDRSVAMKATTFEKQDIVALHETYLGKGSAELVRDAKEIDLDSLAMPFYSRLTSHPHRVYATLQGTLGDCSWDNRYFHLFQKGQTLETMLASEDIYRMSCKTREVAQAASKTTLADSADPFFAMCMGLDNTTLLPPFTPLGRAEEIAFAAVLSHCFSDSIAVYLPWAVLHLPPEARFFSQEHPFQIQLGNWLASCLGMFDLGYASLPVERLKLLGTHLQHFGSLPQLNFENVVRSHMLKSMTNLIEALEERLCNGNLPDFYIRDAQGYIDLLRKSELTSLDNLYRVKGGISTLKKHVYQFGRLLFYWPELVQVAQQLKGEGLMLARPL